MAGNHPIRSHQTPEDEENLSDEVKELIPTLPKEKGGRTQYNYEYKGIWCPGWVIESIITVQRHFHACDTDLILVSFPKSGTTWLKALTFTIVNRENYMQATNPLLTVHPHELVKFLEYGLYAHKQMPDLSNFPLPRIFATHISFPLLPESIKNSKCKIVYICRNPLDNFTSYWNFLIKGRPEHLGPLDIEEIFDLFCKGVSPFGPFWDHVLGYWNESLENPQKILFMKYEDLKEATIPHVKLLADFLGYPFSAKEESDGTIEEILSLCSFESLKELEANKTGQFMGFPTESFFRKGTVGDWANYITPSMAEHLNKIVEEKLAGSGLSFKVSN